MQSHAAGVGVVLEAFLFKRSSGTIKRWQKRWFVVKYHCLWYYHSKDEPEPQACFELAKISNISLEAGHGEGAKEFKITGPQLDYHLKAETLEEAKRWIQVLKQVREEALSLEKDGSVVETEAEREQDKQWKLSKNSRKAAVAAAAIATRKREQSVDQNPKDRDRDRSKDGRSKDVRPAGATNTRAGNEYKQSLDVEVDDYDHMSKSQIQSKFEDLFRGMFMSAHAEGNAMELVDACTQAVDLLTYVVKKFSAKSATPRIDAIEFYLSEYANRICGQINTFVATRIDRMPHKDILILLSWAKDFLEQVKKLEKKFFLGLNRSKPASAAEVSKLVQILIQEYEEKIIIEMKGICSTLADVGFAETQPMQSNEGYLGTETPHAIFDLVEDHIDAVQDKGLPLLTERVITAACTVLSQFQAGQRRDMERRAGDLSEKQLTAMVNDYGLCQVNTDMLIEDVTKILSDSTAVTKVLEDVRKAFQDMTKYTCSILSEFCFIEIKKFFPLLFRRAHLDGEESIFDQMLPLLKVKLEHFKTLLRPTSFATLAEQTMKSLIVAYLRGLFVNKPPNIRQILDQMMLDEARFLRMFGEYVDQKVMFEHIQVLIDVRTIFEEERGLISFTYANMYRQYPDLTPSLFEQLLNMRTDWSRGDRKAAINECKQVVTEARGVVPSSNGFFARATSKQRS